MGLGSSRDYYEPIPGRRSLAPVRTSPGASRAGKRRRRRVFRRLRPSSATTQPGSPIRQHSPHRYPYRSRPFGSPPIYPYAPAVPAGSPPLPLVYNNYTAMPYMQPNQPMMIPPSQPFQPMMIPQQPPLPYSIMVPPQPRPITVAQFSNMMMPQQIPQSVMMQQYMQQPHNAMMPQQILQSQPYRMPQQLQPSMYTPYVSSPYAMSTPYPASYAQQQQQQPQVQPMYNNIGVSAPGPAIISAPSGPYSSANRPAGPNLGTDWTGGGKISPGFLGPPL